MTGANAKIKRILVGDKQVRPSDFKNLLSNIIAYYPMKGNLNDESGHGYNLSVQKGSYTPGDGCNICTGALFLNTSFTCTATNSITLSVWSNPDDVSNTRPLMCIGDDGSGNGWGLSDRPDWAGVVIGWTAYTTTSQTPTSGWHMYSAVFDYTNKVVKLYVDGVLKNSKSGLPSGGIRSNTRLLMGDNRYDRSGTNAHLTGKIGISFAVQNSTTDLLLFYNATKRLYGIS